MNGWARDFNTGPSEFPLQSAARVTDNLLMQIRVLRSECCGHGECVAIAPDVFQLDSRKKVVTLDPESATAELLQEAVEACPCQALVLEDDEGNIFP